MYIHITLTLTQCIYINTLCAAGFYIYIWHMHIPAGRVVRAVPFCLSTVLPVPAIRVKVPVDRDRVCTVEGYNDGEKD